MNKKLNIEVRSVDNQIHNVFLEFFDDYSFFYKKLIEHYKKNNEFRSIFENAEILNMDIDDLTGKFYGYTNEELAEIKRNYQFDKLIDASLYFNSVTSYKLDIAKKFIQKYENVFSKIVFNKLGYKQKTYLDKTFLKTGIIDIDTYNNNLRDNIAFIDTIKKIEIPQNEVFFENNNPYYIDSGIKKRVEVLTKKEAYNKGIYVNKPFYTTDAKKIYIKLNQKNVLDKKIILSFNATRNCKTDPKTFFINSIIIYLFYKKVKQLGYSIDLDIIIDSSTKENDYGNIFIDVASIIRISTALSDYVKFIKILGETLITRGLYFVKLGELYYKYNFKKIPLALGFDSDIFNNIDNFYILKKQLIKTNSIYNESDIIWQFPILQSTDELSIINYFENLVSQYKKIENK